MWREGYVSGGSTRFWVRAMGHGDDVVMLLHGWPETSLAWRRVAPPLAHAGWRVVAPDLKGLGASAKPRGGYDPQTLADEISQLIRNLHVRRAVLVGHDWGGAVALATAFRHPGHVRSLVLASSPYRQLDLRQSWHIPLLNVPVVPELAFHVASGTLVRAALRYGAVQKEAFDDDVVAEYAEGAADRPGAWLTYYRRLSRRAVRDWAVRRIRSRLPLVRPSGTPHRLRVPTLVVWGDADRVTPTHLAPRVAYDLGATLTMIPGTGHFPHEEDPRRFAAAVLAHIGSPASDVQGSFDQTPVDGPLAEES